MQHRTSFFEGMGGIELYSQQWLPEGPPRAIIAIAHMLSRIYSKFSLDLGLDQDAISRQPSVVKAYQDDPLVHGKGSARWGTESLRTVESVKGQAGNIEIPILMVHGEADRINSEEGAKEFFDRIQFADKEFNVYPASYH